MGLPTLEARRLCNTQSTPCVAFNGEMYVGQTECDELKKRMFWHKCVPPERINFSFACVGIQKGYVGQQGTV
jgi:hypothetical protein